MLDYKIHLKDIISMIEKINNSVSGKNLDEFVKIVISLILLTGIV